MIALLPYAVLLALAAAAVWRRPVAAIYVFLVGLALHNAVLALLYGAGVHGATLTAIEAWKETLLAVALARVGLDAWRERRLPFRPGAVDALALAFGTIVVLYAVLPQAALGGHAGSRAVLYALRHDLLPVVAFFLGRSLALGARDLRRLAWALLGTAAALAGIGLVEEYTVPLSFWRDHGAVGWYRHLGFDYHGPGGLPENFAFNRGHDHLLRRLTSTFLSPLATSYLLVVALLVVAAARPLRRRPWLVAGLAALAFAGLLFTFARASVIALAAGLVVLALARRRAWPVAAAAAVVAVGVGFAAIYPAVSPRTHFFRADLVYQARIAKQRGDVGGGVVSGREPSIHSHLTNLGQGLETVGRHPQGFGLGNAGEVVSRLGGRAEAGESNYTELGVETGVAGLALFMLWNLALLGRLVRGARNGEGWAPAGLAAALAAILVVAVQTDAFGVPWLAYCLWGLCGALLAPTPAAVQRSLSPATPGRRPRRFARASISAASSRSSNSVRIAATCPQPASSILRRPASVSTA